MANIDIKEWQIGENTYKFKDEVARQQLATKQDAITQVGITYTEDNGSPDASVDFQNGELAFELKNMKMKFSELTSEEKESIRGKQGDSVLVGQGDLPLTHVLGQGNNKAISQKGFMDALDNETIYIETAWSKSQIEGMTARYRINPDGDEFANAQRGRTIPNFNLYRGKRVRIIL